MKKRFSWVFLLFMTACAPWVPAPGPCDPPSNHFSVVLPEKWMKFKTDDYLLVSKDGPFLQFMFAQRRQVDQPFQHCKMRMQRGMTPEEAAKKWVDAHESVWKAWIPS